MSVAVLFSLADGSIRLAMQPAELHKHHVANLYTSQFLLIIAEVRFRL
jgi:hypothetical protein